VWGWFDRWLDYCESKWGPVVIFSVMLAMGVVTAALWHSYGTTLFSNSGYRSVGPLSGPILTVSSAFCLFYYLRSSDQFRK
jgi:hypothetical protein